MHASLTNDATNQIKDVKIGWSWTTFFFGFPSLVPWRLEVGVNCCRFANRDWHLYHGHFGFYRVDYFCDHLQQDLYQ